MIKIPPSPHVAIIGGGPAGLIAAEILAQQGARVALFEAKPSAGRKFLVAGKGGLNLTHAEPRAAFLARYAARRPQLEPLLNAFGPDEIRAWARGLGVETFVASSGRVFPEGLKAAPLRQAWLQRLHATGVVFHFRHRWVGWDASGRLVFHAPDGERPVSPDAVILALGGASWPQLGSDGGWVPVLAARGVDIAPLQPANCGFDVGWSEHFRTSFAGQPVKPAILTFGAFRQRGEFIVTETGFEGSLIYAASAFLRDEIAASGRAVIELDLTPDVSLPHLTEKLSQRGSRSVSSHLARMGIKGVKANLLREILPPDVFHNPARLAMALKTLPVTLTAPRPLAEAISTAGGVRFEGLDARLMIRALPGVFCAGEMLDWEAPTGGYLLTACLASGRAAGRGVWDWWNEGREGEKEKR
jgi:uncharacterized flavoprotein (TIGR03862 family)